MGFSHCLFLVALAGAAMAFSAQYVPKSYYLIDEDGLKSDVVIIRNRRDLEIPLRIRRGVGSSAYASSSAQASAYAGSDSGYAGGGYGDAIPGLGSRSFAGPGGLGGGSQLGYDGPILFSRSGEDQGTGVQVAGAAQGPNAAFSSSSSSIDENGRIKYNVQSGKY